MSSLLSGDKCQIFPLQTVHFQHIYEKVLHNKKIPLALIFFVYLLIPSHVYASDTCCLGQGGDNYCDFSTNRLYCKNGQVSNQCTCQAAITPTPTAIPTAIPVISPTYPSCPAYSSFSQSNNACTCNSGYIVSQNSCVTYAQYCQAQYGNNALYDSGSNACGCSSGYTWNANATECVTMDDFCNEKLGNQSYYNSTDNQCYCYSGYTIQNSQCQLIPAQSITNGPNTSIPIAIDTPVAIPTLAGVIIPTHSPTKAPDKKSNVNSDLNKKVPGLHGYIAVKKKPEGFFQNIFSTILNIIIKAFNL